MIAFIIAMGKHEKAQKISPIPLWKIEKSRLLLRLCVWIFDSILDFMGYSVNIV